MSGIRGKDTSPELAVRRALYAGGLRYRLHVKGVPGRPDIVLRRLRTAIFVHGCFWHRHPGCRFAYTPRSNTKFWKAKFAENVARDRRIQHELKRAGWKVIILWECALSDARLRRLTERMRTMCRG